METLYKLVEFENWCPKCKYKDVDETSTEETKWDICSECLDEPARVGTRKPINFKEKSSSDA